MQDLPKRTTSYRIARMCRDEWPMFALLTAAIVQTGFALQAMNGVVRSNHPISLIPQSEESLASQPAATEAPAADPVKVASTFSTPSGGG